MSYINVFVLCKTNPMKQAKSLMDMINGWHRQIWTSANLGESYKTPKSMMVHEGQQDLLLSICMYFARQIQ